MWAFQFKKRMRGFTLIELLVVISIMGILTSLTLVSYSGAQKQTRDTQRRSDLNQYRNGLETYASNNNGLYPDNAYSGDSVNKSGIFAEDGPLIDEYLTSFIADPVNVQTGTFQYYYSYYGASDGLSYKLVAGLETGGYWVICSNGKSGKVDSAPAENASCDF